MHWRWLAGALLLAVVASPVARAARCAEVEKHLAPLTQAQVPDVAQVLRQMEGTGRRLLALRSYLRASKTIATRWSWTQEQIDTYRESAEYQVLLAEIERIRTRFEADNPGYQLYANTDVRSLDVQIERWNGNVAVGAIASDLEQALCTKFAATPSRAASSSLRDFLEDWVPEQPAPLAAPGLSLHGRARAIDFQVHKGSQVIAGAATKDIASAWIAQGWGRKLASAIHATSTKFVGPLTMPNEPWHFEYQP